MTSAEICDVKIPEVEEHVRKYHSGQEVILQVSNKSSIRVVGSSQFQIEYDYVSFRTTTKRMRMNALYLPKFSIRALMVLMVSTASK